MTLALLARAGERFGAKYADPAVLIRFAFLTTCDLRFVFVLFYDATRKRAGFLPPFIYLDKAIDLRRLVSAMRVIIAAAAARVMEEFGVKVPTESLPVRIPAR